MPKVISVLEELEDFATRFESEGREIITLQTAVNRLELDKLDRVEDQTRHEKELEQIEEAWRSETQELVQLIERLKDENQQLKLAVADKKNNVHTPITSHLSKDDSKSDEIQLMLRLKEIIDHQKIQIRSLRQQLTQKHVDLDAMQQQTTRLAKLNAILRRKHFVSKRQADQLQNEKNDLELLLKTKDQLIQQIKENVCYHLASETTPNSPFITGMSKSLIGELVSPETPPAEITEKQLIERLNTEDKMIINSRDSNRPQFTMQELKDVLTERNKLKSRLIEVEEELTVYQRAGDDAPPVQGPINCEPDEKLYTHLGQDSEIKKFFTNLLSKLNR